MIKNNEGISLITLVITIIVIIILTSIFISTGLNSLDEVKNSEVKNEMYNLKQAVVTRFTSYQKNDGNVTLIGTYAKSKWSDPNDCIDKVIPTLEYDDTDTSDDKIAKAERVSNSIKADYDEYVMIIKSEDMKKLGLDSVYEKNVYIVDYYMGAVYGPIEE